MIPPTFVTYASGILAETLKGISGPQIVEILSKHAYNFNVKIPYSSYPFPQGVSNKRSALAANLHAFSPEQQFLIIKDLCEFDRFKDNNDVKELKIRLISRFGILGRKGDISGVDPAITEETLHWLSDFPESNKLYDEALTKYSNGIYNRNALDDLRLSLEKLIQSILGNTKSLENQLGELGAFITSRKGSKELMNMFVKLIEYYTKYQNTYVKHDDAVIETEISIILELTSSFMKYVIRIK
jgi:hypothetical protein